MSMSTSITICNGRTQRVLLLCIAALLCMGALATPALAAAPVAAFSGTPTSGTSPLTVVFIDTSANSPTSRVWDFGDGNSTWSTTATTFSHTYFIAGNYSVKLTVSNGDGSDTMTRANYISAQCNLKISGMVVPNPGPATLFANENNTIAVTMVQNLAGNSPPVSLTVTASDGWSTTVAVRAMNASETIMGVTVGIDPTIRSPAGTTVTYTAIINPGSTVPETSYSDNTKTSVQTVKYNGYKGVQYWNGKTAPSTRQMYDIRGNVVHSFGDSYYKSGKGSAWSTLTWHFGYNTTNPIAADIQIPANATIKAARLYIPYCWDYENEIGTGTATTTFNGVTITPLHMEQDESNFGAYDDFLYGLVTYDVTSLYVKNATNTAVFTRTLPGTGSLSPAGFTLMVVYEDPSETRKQIFINEGWDLLGAAQAAYATTEDEAISYQEFTGMTIDMGSAIKANLSTFVPWGAPQHDGESGEGRLYVNGNLLGSMVWNYGNATGVWGENGMPQVAVDTRDILSSLKAGGTGNMIAIQSEASDPNSTQGSPCMFSERSMLIVTYPDPAPVAAFSGTPTSGTSLLTVFFTDTSTNNPITRVWDFGDGNSSWSTTATKFSHTYTGAASYSVRLTVTNDGGSDDELKTGYITVTGGSTPIPLPGYTNPPTDPDHDGLYEDLNANNRKDMGDVVLFFENKNWIAANEPLSAFDFNANTRIDLGDVVVLFEEIV